MMTSNPAPTQGAEPFKYPTGKERIGTRIDSGNSNASSFGYVTTADRLEKVETYRVWSGPNLLGMVWRFTEGQWFAQSLTGALCDRFDSLQEAKAAVVDSWERSQSPTSYVPQSAPFPIGTRVTSWHLDSDEICWEEGEIVGHQKMLGEEFKYLVQWTRNIDFPNGLPDDWGPQITPHEDIKPSGSLSLSHLEGNAGKATLTAW